MLSLAERSTDWPVVTSRLELNSPFNYFRRSVSVPSSTSSDTSSPVDEIMIEDVFQTLINSMPTVSKMMSPAEKKNMRKLRSQIDTETESSEDLGSGNKVKEAVEITSKQVKKGDKNKKKKKKRKWKIMDESELGFNTSLLPRPSRSSHLDEEKVQNLLAEIDEEYLNMEEKISKFECVQEFEGLRLENRYLRLDRDRKIQKAHKQVKDKYCKSVRNNDGRKKLYVHHRVMRLMTLEAERAHLHYPLPPKKNAPDFVNNVSSRQGRHYNGRPAPVQNLRHALHENVQPADLPTDLVSLLITLQHRDITPEDYDVLLRLDESVAAQTISQNILDSFKTDIVDDKSAGEVCAVCMDPYIVGQKRKFLPCAHYFHGSCIDMWLQNSSMNCPLDGLPVDQ